jgi:hypothetical protein
MAPTVRCTLRMAKLPVTGVCDSSAGGLGDELVIERLVEAVILRLHLAAARNARGQRGRVEDRGERSMPLAFQWSSAMCGVDLVHAAHHFVDGAEAELGHVLAHLLGDEEEEVDDVLGLAGEAGAQHGSCVAMPTEQVFRWHLRIMMQPMAISGVVAKPNSSAPSSAAMTTSRPVCSLPSVCTRMRLRRSLSSSTCCVSARPSSQGRPACLMELSGEAPVPPCRRR